MEGSWLVKYLKKFGKIDILVNNAGIGTLQDFEKEDERGWETMLSVNAKSIWLGIKSVVHAMKDKSRVR